MDKLNSVTSAMQGVNRSVHNGATENTIGAKFQRVQEAASPTPLGDGVSISTLAGRLSVAASALAESTSSLGYTELNSWLSKSLQAVNYPFDSTHRTVADKEVPAPNDAGAAKSARAATEFLDGIASGQGTNPFAGLSREQLSTITHDQTGTFTVNERRAASRQADSDEQTWRIQVIAQGTREYQETGKLTDFFKDALSHFENLPSLEKALYPENYATDLREKIKLDFNYFTNSAANATPSAVSIASLNKGTGIPSSNELLTFPN